MTKRNLFQSFVATLGVLMAAGAAHAQAISANTTYVYGTYWDIPAAGGSLLFAGGSSAQGGLCANTVSGPCTNLGLPAGDSFGTLISGGTTTEPGYIQIFTPSAMANYQLTLTITNTQGIGDIYDIVVNGSSLGTTSVVAYNASAGGSNGTFFTTIDGGNVPISISITDLLEQFMGTSSYTVPSQLGGPTTDNLPANKSLSLSNYPPDSEFTLVATFTNVPEPASLSILALGGLAVGAARRRRAKAVRAAT
jgi:hypothetical protein